MVESMNNKDIFLAYAILPKLPEYVEYISIRTISYNSKISEKNTEYHKKFGTL